jgi:branched-chain amino acid transport system substrate-binding protein
MNEKVNFIVGTTHTPCGMAISEVCKELKVIFFNGCVKTSELTEEWGHPYVFSTASDTVYEGRAMAMLERDNSYKKYWCIGWDYAYGHNVIKAFRNKLKEVKPNAEVIQETSVKVGEMEFIIYYTMMNSGADDCLYVLGFFLQHLHGRQKLIVF